jgi:putative ABC transport system permease protein
MPSLARKNLLEDIPRFLVAQAGIMFAVSLVTIQTGIQAGFTRSTSQLIDNSTADIWVSSRNMVHLGLTVPMSYDLVAAAQNVEGVELSEGLMIRGAAWRNSQNQLSSVTLVGFEPDGQLFQPWNIAQGSISSLKIPYTVMVDENSLSALHAERRGDVGVVGSLPAHIVGITRKTKSLVLGDLMFASLETAYTYVTSPITAKIPCDLADQNVDCALTDGNFPPEPQALSANDPFAILSGRVRPGQTIEPLSFILVKAKSGASIESLQQKLEEALPNTRAYTKAEMSKLTQDYWARRSGIGFVLGIGAVVGIVVGAVIVSQILYSSVSDRVKEYGTLKAMGSSDLVIYGVIVEQALWMAVLGYIPGMALCWGVATWTAVTQGILILITPGSAIAVFGITVAMCVASAGFAIQKVTRVDPAIVFKG